MFVLPDLRLSAFLFFTCCYFLLFPWNRGFSFDDLTSTPYTQSCNEKLRPKKRRIPLVAGWDEILGHDGCLARKIPLSTKTISKVCLQTYTRSQSWVCFGSHVVGMSFHAVELDGT
ncbi:hypothetical protein QL093DRAFT_2280944 [Fusarium oxysporum]|nr:hypothetical protein QL093DRAFT_2280944 [Fusarium oxysporum]